MRESEIIRRCLQSDKYAWDLFIEKYSRLIYWAIRKRLAMNGFQINETDAEDIFQDVLLSIFEGQKLKQIKDPRFIPGWLSMVASNKTVDFMRRKERREQNVTGDMPVFSDPGFKEDLLRSDMVSEIKDIINTLPDKERIIISLNLLEEKTHKEIAGIMGVSINTVSTVIARTKKRLREKLEKSELGTGIKKMKENKR